MNKKHRPNNTLLSKEALDPIIIEIGRIENSIIGIFFLVIFIFLFKHSACYSF